MPSPPKLQVLKHTVCGGLTERETCLYSYGEVAIHAGVTCCSDVAALGPSTLLLVNSYPYSVSKLNKHWLAKLDFGEIVTLADHWFPIWGEQSIVLP